MQVSARKSWSPALDCTSAGEDISAGEDSPPLQHPPYSYTNTLKNDFAERPDTIWKGPNPHPTRHSAATAETHVLPSFADMAEQANDFAAAHAGISEQRDKRNAEPSNSEKSSRSASPRVSPRVLKVVHKQVHNASPRMLAGGGG